MPLSGAGLQLSRGKAGLVRRAALKVVGRLDAATLELAELDGQVGARCLEGCQDGQRRGVRPGRAAKDACTLGAGGGPRRRHFQSPRSFAASNARRGANIRRIIPFQNSRYGPNKLLCK